MCQVRVRIRGLSRCGIASGAMSDRAEAVRATGGCLCGAVRYEVRGALRDVVLCHCSHCRRTHGHVAAYAACAGSDLVVTDAGALRWYADGDRERGFCARCGASLLWRAAGRDTVSVAAGTIDPPTGLRTVGQIFVASAGDYYEAGGEGARFADALPPGWPGDAPPIPPQRLAVAADAPAIAALMRASVLDAFPAFYDARQTASAAVHIAHLDMQLIEDGTYFVHTVGREIVACGGWSRRNKLYSGSGAGDDDERLLDPVTEPARVRAMFVRGDWTRRGLGRAILVSCERAARLEGFRELVLGATLPGVLLYRAFGFEEIERFTVTMPDGVEVTAVAMRRAIADA